MITFEEFKTLVWKEFIVVFKFGDEITAKKYFESADSQDFVHDGYRDFCHRVEDKKDSDAPYWAETCAYNLAMLY